MPVNLENMACPIPLSDYPHVLMAHGSGGRLMNRLITSMFLSAFPDVQHHDSALVELESKKTAMTTDSFVINPLVFPGGDIGSLAVHGTVNDLAMAGAKPEFLSVAFILEEGLSMELLWKVVRSMSKAAADAGVKIITGDTKVVERSSGDGLYINTTGIGSVIEGTSSNGPDCIREGDSIILSGDIGRHGMAVMSVREGLTFESIIKSDSEDISKSVLAMFDDGIKITCMRDATRGGVAAVLNELAEASRMSFQVEEQQIPVTDSVRGACEILGLDPLHVANEGRFLAFVSPEDTERAVAAINRYHSDTEAVVIGRVVKAHPGRVILKTAIGSSRILDMPSGELLPRIC